MADSVETLGVDLSTRVKTLEVTEKARRKKCTVRFSIIKKNESPFPFKPDLRPTENKRSRDSKAESLRRPQTCR